MLMNIVTNSHLLCVISILFNLFLFKTFEAGRGAAARGVIAKPTGCGFDPYSSR